MWAPVAYRTWCMRPLVLSLTYQQSIYCYSFLHSFQCILLKIFHNIKQQKQNLWICSCFWIAAPKFYPFLFLLMVSKVFHLFVLSQCLTWAVTFCLTLFLLTLDRNTERISIGYFSHPWILKIIFKILHQIQQAFEVTSLKWEAI